MYPLENLRRLLLAAPILLLLGCSDTSCWNMDSGCQKAEREAEKRLEQCKEMEEEESRRCIAAIEAGGNRCGQDWKGCREDEDTGPTVLF